MCAILIAGSRGYPASYGGFETLTHKLAEYLSEKGNEIIVTGFSGYQRKLVRRIEYRDGLIKTVTIGIPMWSRVRNLVCTFLAVVFSIRKYDITHALVLNEVNILTALFLKACKIKTCIHLDGDESARRGLPKMGRLMHVFFRGLTYKYMDKLILDSSSLITKIPVNFRKKVNLIKYGIDSTEIYGSEFSLEPFLVKDQYVLGVARFVPENNLKEIIRAYLASNCDFPLVLFGKGTGTKRYEKELESLANLKKSKILIFRATYDSKFIHYLLANSYLYVHGHEVGGTNPILVSARYFAKRIAAHKNIYNVEGSGHKERFWNSPSQLTEIFNHIKDKFGDTDNDTESSTEIETWNVISAKYLEIIKGSEH